MPECAYKKKETLMFKVRHVCRACGSTFYCANTCQGKHPAYIHILSPFPSCLCHCCALRVLSIDFLTQEHKNKQATLLNCSVLTKDEKGQYQVRRMSEKLGLND